MILGSVLFEHPHADDCRLGGIHFSQFMTKRSLHDFQWRSDLRVPHAGLQRPCMPWTATSALLSSQS